MIDKTKNNLPKKGNGVKTKSTQKTEQEKPQVIYRSYTLGRRLGLR